MAIHDWPVDERPREKLLKHGAGRLSDAELLAVLLGSGVRGTDALALARQMLADSGSLGALLASPRPLRTNGLGPAKQARLTAALELARRTLREELHRSPALNGSGDAARFLSAQLRHLPHEVFACLYLDKRYRVLAFEELFRGTIDGTSVHPREVVRACLNHNAAAVILAHNHPSGVAEPSEADHQITHTLCDALALIGVQVVDHLIIGAGEPTSLALCGDL